MFVLRKIVKQSETQKITPGSRLEGQRSGFIQATSRACNWISAVTGQAQALSQGTEGSFERSSSAPRSILCLANLDAWRPLW